MDDKKTPIASDYTVTPADRNFIYDGNPKSVTVTPKAGASPGTITAIKYNGSTTAPSAVGLYEIAIDVDAADGWNAVNNLLVGVFIIKEVALDTPVMSDFIITGIPQTVTQGNLPNPAISITAKPGSTTGDITIRYTNMSTGITQDTFPTEVGLYNVDFVVAADSNYCATSLRAGTVFIRSRGDLGPSVTVTQFSDFDVTIGGVLFTTNNNNTAPVEVVNNGSAQTVIVTPKAGTTYPIDRPGAVTYVYYDIGGTTEQRLGVAPTDVGSYRVKVNLAVTLDLDKNMAWEGTEFNLWFNITP